MSMLLNAVSGLNAANAALLVAGNNTANAAVKGYSRQTVYLDTAAGNLGGVKITKVDRIVSEYLNDDIWRTGADANYYKGFQSYLGYVEELIGSDSLNLNNVVADIKASLNAALDKPESDAYRQQTLSNADALVQNIAQISSALQGQQTKLSKELKDLSLNTTSVLQQIAELNGKISKANALGEPTAELMDARELITTELSSYTGINILNQADGTISISAKNGAPLVIGSKAATLSVSGSTGTDVVATFNNQNFPLNGQVGGRIGGLLAVNDDVLVSTMNRFSDMVKNIADSVNDVLAQGFDLNGAPGEPLFIYNAADPLGTFAVNPDINAKKLAFTGGKDDGAGNWIPAGGQGDNSNIKDIVAALNSSTAGYDVLVGDLAIHSKQMQSSVKTADILNGNAVSARDNLSGVNLDEEAANVLFFQKMYGANAKVISVADEMFRTLITMF